MTTNPSPTSTTPAVSQLFFRCSPPAARRSLGFTLVEILVVVVIIGMLTAFVVPAAMRAITRAKQTSQKMEVNTLAQAVEQYFQKYGDYPPDGSNFDVLSRHMRKLFPRMSPQVDAALLTQLTRRRGTTDFSFVAMDRAEALVFFLGGFSEDPQFPITGEGGPLKLVRNADPNDLSVITDLANYEYNATRDNTFFPFEIERLTLSRSNPNAPLLSTDEIVLGVNDTFHGFQDPLPAYLATSDGKTPIVYFDSRTYGEVDQGVYNGYLAGNYPSELGAVRPYKSEAVVEPPSPPNYQSVQVAFDAVPFHNRDTFQIISPGSDGVFGAAVSTDPADIESLPIHYVTETGRAVWPNANATNPGGLVFSASGLGSNGFQDQDWLEAIRVNGQLDNVTNFSSTTLESDLE